MPCLWFCATCITHVRTYVCTYMCEQQLCCVIATSVHKSLIMYSCENSEHFHYIAVICEYNFDVCTVAYFGTCHVHLWAVLFWQPLAYTHVGKAARSCLIILHKQQGVIFSCVR